MKNYLIRSNTSAVETVAAGGAIVDLSFDTQTLIEGTDVSYSAGEFTLAAGVYLIAYSSEFFTSDSTNNQRFSIQTEIWVDTGGGYVLYGGFGHGYIRKNSGQFTIAIDGSDFLEISTTSTVKIRAYRDDDSTIGSCVRLAGAGGISIIQIEPADTFGLYTASGSTAFNAITQVGINTTIRQDTGISLSSNVVTLADSGQYVVNFSSAIFQTATARNTAMGAIRINGTVYEASNAMSYVRGTDSTQSGGISWIGIIDVAAGATIDLSLMTQTSTNMTATAGTKLNIWKLPDSAKSTIIEATGGNVNAIGEFSFDTEATSSDIFTYTAGQPHITVSEAADILVFATMGKRVTTAATRATPVTRIAVNDAINTAYSGSSYNRNSGGNSAIGHNVVGVVSVTAAQQISLYNARFASNSTAIEVSGAQLALLDLDSIYATGAAGQTVIPNTITTDEVVFNPEFDFGSVSVIPNTISSSEVLFTPTILVAAIVVAPNTIGTSEVLFTPTLSVGAVTLVPNLIISDEVVFNPEIAFGAVTVAPNTIVSSEVLYTPTISFGATLVTPNIITSDEAVFNPEFSFGAVTVTPNTITSSEILFTPSISTGSVTITPNTIVTDEIVFNPELLADAVSISPNTIVTNEVVFNPEFNVGTVSVTPNTVTSNEVVFNPELLADAISISPNTITSGEVFFTPEIALGSVSVLPNTITSDEVFFAPELLADTVVISPNAITSDEVIFNPEFTLGEIFVSPDTIVTNEVVFNPNLLADATYISPNTITSDEIVFNPTFSFGSVSVTPNAITSDEVVFNPEFDFGSVLISPNTISTSEAVFEPELLADTVLISPNTITTSEELFTPTIALGEVIVQVSTIETAEQVYNPAIEVIVLEISPEAITSDEVFYNPSILLGGISVSPNKITSDEDIFNPIIYLNSGKLVLERPKLTFR